MDDRLRQDFLAHVKEEYHNEPAQIKLQEQDEQRGGNRKNQEGKHKRWGREMQRRCGTKNLWELISFTGKFDPIWLAEKLAKAQEASSTSTSEKQQQLVRIAVEARNRLRLAKKSTSSASESPTGLMKH